MSKAFIVVGLGFGDEGKGTVVDYLAREHNARMIVRFNGGAQAAHNVVTPEGKHHTFAQFGSGTLAGARTHLSRFMLVNPFDMALETRHLQQLGISSPLSMLSISPDALVTTPLHIAANQLREERRSRRHGTCGKGIGETQHTAEMLGGTAVRIKDLPYVNITESKLRQLSNYYMETLSEDFAEHHGDVRKIAEAYGHFASKVETLDDYAIQDLLRDGHCVIFEGAQGILLDQDVGFHPHTTWSKTTSHNARELIEDSAPITQIGVTRAYTTRHGEGPMVHRATAPFSSSHFEPHNDSGGYQGKFWFGAWDALALDYAATCDPPDEVAVTCLDHLSKNWQSIWSYDYVGDMPDLSPYFWAQGSRIFQINQGSGRAYVEALTRRLLDCAANLNTHNGVDAEYIADAIGEVLHAPVTLQSFGPTYKDKEARVFEWSS